MKNQFVAVLALLAGSAFCNGSIEAQVTPVDYSHCDKFCDYECASMCRNKYDDGKYVSYCQPTGNQGERRICWSESPSGPSTCEICRYVQNINGTFTLKCRPEMSCPCTPTRPRFGRLLRCLQSRLQQRRCCGKFRRF